MKERFGKRMLLWLFVFCCGLFVNGAKAEAKSLKDQDVKIVQSYVVIGTAQGEEEESMTPKVMIYDGERILEEGKDYTLKLKEYSEEDEWEYSIIVAGIGDYEDTVMAYSDICGVEKTLKNWKVLEFIEEEDDLEELYILSYIGNASTVTVPKKLDNSALTTATPQDGPSFFEDASKMCM